MTFVERVRERAAHPEWGLGRLGLALLAVVPFVVGWALGTVVKVGKIIWAAFVEGYSVGVKL